MQETKVWSLGWEAPIEKKLATHSSILAWEIPLTEEPGGLQSMGSQELDTAYWWNHHNQTIWASNITIFLIFLYIVVGFAIHWHESAMDLHVFRIPIPLPTSLPTPSSWVFPVHQPRALVSCIQPGLVICFTLDNIHVSMLFFQNIPPLPSPTESKSLFCTSVSLFLFCI